jgi:hypothetical protein
MTTIAPSIDLNTLTPNKKNDSPHSKLPFQNLTQNKALNMSTSDLVLNVSKFKPENISANTQAVNGYILSQVTKQTSEPRWWEVS